MGFFNKRVGEAPEPELYVPQESRAAAHDGMSVYLKTVENGQSWGFSLNPPKTKFDAQTGQPNPWTLSGSQFGDKPLYIDDPWSTVSPSGMTNSFDYDKKFFFRVAQDPRNGDKAGSFCVAKGTISDISYMLMPTEPTVSISQQRINGVDNAPYNPLDHMYTIQTANSTYSLTAKRSANGAQWYLNGGSDKQVFCNVPVELNNFRQGEPLGFTIANDPSVPERARGQYLHTGLIVSATDYIHSVGACCDAFTRQETLPLQAPTDFTHDGSAFIGSRENLRDYNRSDAAMGFDVVAGRESHQPEAIAREDSHISRPGIYARTKSGSEYSFEPTRNPDVWHMIDHKRGGVFEIEPLHDTYAELNAGHQIRCEAQEIIGSGPIRFRAYNNQYNAEHHCPFPMGIVAHTSPVESVSTYEPTWMQRERMADLQADDISASSEMSMQMGEEW